MKSLEVPSAKGKQAAGPLGKLSIEVFNPKRRSFAAADPWPQVMKTPLAKPDKKYVNVPQTLFESKAPLLPKYTSYITLRRNVLTEDDECIRYWPYFGIGEENEKATETFYESVLKLFPQNRLKGMQMLHIRAEQAIKYRPYVERFLSEVGCAGTDILYYLLDDSTSPVPVKMSPESEEAWKSRASHLEEDFSPSDDDGRRKWEQVRQQLAPTSKRALGVAGLACTAFKNRAPFSLWHIAKRYRKIMNAATPGRIAFNTPASSSQLRPTGDESSEPLGTYEDLGCRLCFA
ncbi:MAG: hypothetical protein M1819_007273 [Sarea resinae]|nr:MAG: hypothetical protein M1819_007273 [Sarea resinae]